MAAKIRVLVVDDSAYLRKIVSRMLESSSEIEVVGTARDGQMALEMTAKLDPDVITLDLNMAGLDGVEFLRRQMAVRPVAVVIVSIASEEGQLAAEAIELGAVEFVRKPTGLASEKVMEIQTELVEKIKAAANIPRDKLRPFAPAGMRRARLSRTDGMGKKIDAVVLGLSTGGPQALRFLLSELPADFPVPIAAVLHMPVGYTRPFAAKLDQAYRLEILEAKAGLTMQPGRLILGQAGRHLKLARRMGEVVCELEIEPSDSSHRPAVDVLFQSAAQIYGPRLLAVVLTGMGSDGTPGSAWVKANGGRVLAEAESSCVVYGMPRSVAEAGLADLVRPLSELPGAIFDEL